MNIRCDEYEKNIQRYQSKLENVKQEYNRMTAETEDLKHNKVSEDGRWCIYYFSYYSDIFIVELFINNYIVLFLFSYSFYYSY